MVAYRRQRTRTACFSVKASAAPLQGFPVVVNHLHRNLNLEGYWETAFAGAARVSQIGDDLVKPDRLRSRNA